MIDQHIVQAVQRAIEHTAKIDPTHRIFRQRADINGGIYTFGVHAELMSWLLDNGFVQAKGPGCDDAFTFCCPSWFIASGYNPDMALFTRNVVRYCGYAGLTKLREMFEASKSPMCVLCPQGASNLKCEVQIGKVSDVLAGLPTTVNAVTMSIDRQTVALLMRSKRFDELEGHALAKVPVNTGVIDRTSKIPPIRVIASTTELYRGWVWVEVRDDHLVGDFREHHVQDLIDLLLWFKPSPKKDDWVRVSTF